MTKNANITYSTPAGVVVLIQWPDGKLSSRSVPWADLKRSGDDALVEACELVSAGLTDSPWSEVDVFEIVAASRGHGYIFHRVSLRSSFQLDGFGVSVL